MSHDADRRTAALSSSEFTLLHAADVIRAINIIETIKRQVLATLTAEQGTVRTLVLTKAQDELRAVADNALESALFTWQASRRVVTPIDNTHIRE